jgi:hypothetical protein
MLKLIGVYLSALAESETIADELNPLAISQIPRNISFRIIGRPKIIPTSILMPISPNLDKPEPKRGSNL